MFDQITQAGKAAGITFDLDGIERGVNTLNAHRLLDFTFQQQGLPLQNKLSEALFKAYFCEQRDIGNTEVLTLIASEAGMKGEQVNTYLKSGDNIENIEKQIAFARQQGINGVPSFNLDGLFVLSGGQQSEVFLGAIDRLAAKTAD